jgi:hypothetical protein
MLKKVSSHAALLALSAFVAQADTISLNPTADAFVAFRAGNAANDTNFGSSNQLDLYQNGDIYMYAYVRFDFSSLGNITINSATLTFTKTSNTVESGYPVVSARNDTLTTGRFGVFGLTDASGNTAQNWGETTITANNVGSERIASQGAQFDTTTRVVSFDGINETVSSGTTASITGSNGSNLVSFLQERVSPTSFAGSVTFIVDFPGTGTGQGFALASREAVSGMPVLMLDYTPVPEPSAFALLAGLAGMGCVGLRRRRRA